MSARKLTRANADPALAYELEMPPGWLEYEPLQPDLSAGPGLHLLGRVGPPGGRSVIEVLTQVLDRELSAADWLDAWVAANGYEVKENVRTTSSAGFDARILATAVIDGVRFLYRFTTLKNGRRLYLLSGFARTDEMSELDAGYARVRDTFQLLAPNEPTAEALRTTRLEHVVTARVALPSGWVEERDESAGPDQDSVTFKNHVEGQAVAQIHVLVTPAEGFGSHRELADHVLAAAQLRLPEPLPPIELAPVALPLADPLQGNAFLQVDTVYVRIRITVARLGDAWTSVLLFGFTPVPDTMLIDAMNNRAYEIALTTLSAAS